MSSIQRAASTCKLRRILYAFSIGEKVHSMIRSSRVGIAKVVRTRSLSVNKTDANIHVRLHHWFGPSLFPSPYLPRPRVYQIDRLKVQLGYTWLCKESCLGQASWQDWLKERAAVDFGHSDQQVVQLAYHCALSSKHHVWRCYVCSTPHCV